MIFRFKALPRKKIIIGILLFIMIIILGNVYSIHKKRSYQHELAKNIKKLSDLQFLSFPDDKMNYTSDYFSSIGVSGGLGIYCGKEDQAVWDGTMDIPDFLEYDSYGLLRLSESQLVNQTQYVDFLLGKVENDGDPSVKSFIDSVGFIYDDESYIIISNEQIYKVADKTFFIDLMNLLKEYHYLPPRIINGRLSGRKAS